MIESGNSKTVYAPQRLTTGWRLSYFIFILIAILYLLPFMRVFLVDSRVEGSVLYDATRVVRGQVFARDFFEVIGPGSIYLMAAYFKLFGVTFLATRINLFVSSLGTGLAIYFLSRQVCSRYRALPAVILAAIYFGGSWPAVNHHVDSNFWGLLSVVFLLLWYRQRNHYLLVVVGVLAAFTTFIHLPKGTLLFCAFMVWLWLYRRTIAVPLAAMGILAGGYLTAVAVILGYFWSQGALSDLIYANFVFPSHHYAAVNQVHYAHGMLRFYWHPWVSGKVPAWFLGIAVIVITPPVFITALPLLVCIAGLRYKWKSITPQIALYWFCGWAMWFSEIHRKEFWHLAFGSPLLIILCIKALTECQHRFATAVLGILSISSICLALINCAVVLTAGSRQIATPAGNLALVGKDSPQVLNFLVHHASIGEEVLCYPYCPAYNFLSATVNPTRYSYLLYNYNTPKQFQEVIDALDRQRVKYVIWDAAFEKSASIDDLPGSQPKDPSDLIIEPYLKSRYRMIENDQGIYIMQRAGR